MSTQAAPSKKTRSLGATAPAPWKLTINEGNGTLSDLSGAEFQIDHNMPRPLGQLTEFSGIARTRTLSPQLIPFTGYSDSAQIISFSLTLSDGKLYSFFGVRSPVDPTFMGGIIVSGDLEALVGDAAEDEGSWSAQAPPREEDYDRPRRKTAENNGRA